MAAKTFDVQKRTFFESKKHCKSISNQKIVYARDEDPEDTCIIRSLYGEDDKFGVLVSRVIRRYTMYFFPSSS